MKTNNLPPKPPMTDAQREYLRACGKLGLEKQWPDPSAIEDPIERQKQLDKRKLFGERMTKGRQKRMAEKIENKKTGIAI